MNMDSVDTERENRGGRLEMSMGGVSEGGKSGGGEAEAKERGCRRRDKGEGGI